MKAGIDTQEREPPNSMDQLVSAEPAPATGSGAPSRLWGQHARSIKALCPSRARRTIDVMAGRESHDNVASESCQATDADESDQSETSHQNAQLEPLIAWHPVTHGHVVHVAQYRRHSRRELYAFCSFSGSARAMYSVIPSGIRSTNDSASGPGIAGIPVKLHSAGSSY